MASAPQPALPLFFNDLMPINSRDHLTWKSKNLDNAKFLGATHAVPLTVDEFVDAQRSFPIIFTAGNASVPLALMGLDRTSVVSGKSVSVSVDLGGRRLI